MINDWYLVLVNTFSHICVFEVCADSSTCHTYIFSFIVSTSVIILFPWRNQSSIHSQCPTDYWLFTSLNVDVVILFLYEHLQRLHWDFNINQKFPISFEDNSIMREFQFCLISSYSYLAIDFGEFPKIGSNQNLNFYQLKYLRVNMLIAYPH